MRQREIRTFPEDSLRAGSCSGCGGEGRIVVLDIGRFQLRLCHGCTDEVRTQLGSPSHFAEFPAPAQVRKGKRSKKSK